MEIINVTIIVRNTAGQVKKAVFAPGCEPTGSHKECLDALGETIDRSSADPEPEPSPEVGAIAAVPSPDVAT